MDQSVIAFTVFAAFLAISDVAAVKTKAMLDSMLVFSVVLCVAFWLGMPYSLVNSSHFMLLAYVCLALMLTNMGSTITLDQFSKEWKTACIGFIQVAVICVIVYFGSCLLINKVYAYAGAPIVAGGFVAYLVMMQPLKSAGMSTAVSFCLLLMVAQSLIGIPISSYLVTKDAKRLIRTGEIEKYRSAPVDGVSDAGHDKKKRRLIPPIPEKYNKPSVLLTKVAIVAMLGIAVSNLTGGKVNFLICCLIMGIIMTHIGFLDERALEKARADGIVMLIVIVYTFEGVHDLTPGLLVSLMKPFLVTMLFGLLAIFLGGFICSKIFKVSFQMASTIGLTALYGFPATYYIAKEVAEACSNNSDDQTALENYLVPRMMIAGFATVSIGSIIAASAMLPGLMAMI